LGLLRDLVCLREPAILYCMRPFSSWFWLQSRSLDPQRIGLFNRRRDWRAREEPNPEWHRDCRGLGGGGHPRLSIRPVLQAGDPDPAAARGSRRDAMVGNRRRYGSLDLARDRERRMVSRTTCTCPKRRARSCTPCRGWRAVTLFSTTRKRATAV